MSNAERTDAKRDDARTPIGHDAGDKASGESSGDARREPRESGMRGLHIWQIQSIRDLLVIAAVAGTVWIGYTLRTVTVPLLIALTLAYLFEPVVARLAQWKRMNRPLAVGCILALLGGALTLMVAIVVPLAVGQTLSFASSLRSGKYDGFVERAMTVVPEEYRADAREWADRIIHPRSSEERASHEEQTTESDVSTANTTASQTADSANAAAEKQASAAAEKQASAAAEKQASAAAAASVEKFPVLPTAITEVSLDNPVVTLLGAGAGQVYGFALGLLQLGLVAFLIPFYFYYFSVYWPAIVGFFASLVPDEHSSNVASIVAEMDRAVAGFVRGRIVICVIMGVLFAIGWQVCGVPYGIALGLLTGAFSIVPYLGGIGLPFAVVLLAADQFALDPSQRMALWGMLVWPTVVFVTVQTIEGYLLTPVIAGKATNLDPVTIVVAILAGGSIAGIYGMLLAIPIAACGKIAARRLLLPRIQDWARGKVADPLPIARD
ncbi:MAG: AI-2E family transporter [Limnohabitans sp.]|nr:AI-2E family transporter [Limnohabitans sp.]